MADFKTAHKIVMVNEGGYANNATDRGGETYKGISRKNFPSWPGWNIVDTYDEPRILIKNQQLAGNATLQSAVLDFYKTEFWDELNLDKISSPAIATELYDTGVNMGTGTAALFLQRSLNVSNHNGKDYPDLKLDARIGPTTIAVLNNHSDPVDVLKVINCLQGGKYVGIMEADPTQEIFFRSWFSRVAL